MIAESGQFPSHGLGRGRRTTIGVAARPVRRADPSPSSLSESATSTGEFTNLLISAFGCLVVTMLFLLSSEEFTHWFVIPVYLCGTLIGRDAVRWARRGCTLLDPYGLIGLIGVHFFFLAPLLHVKTGYFLWYVDPPDDWRPWLGKMAWINLAAIIGYLLGRRVLELFQVRRRSVVIEWRPNPQRLTLFLASFMALSIVLQGFVYYRFGGISGYVATYSNISQGASFEGFGWIFMLSEPFPILAVFAYALWTQRTGRGRGWAMIAFVLVSFLIARLLFGGLRGSRANIVWPLFWTIGIIHLWVRPISRKLVLGGLVFLVLFMYSYSFYKFYGTSALDVASGNVVPEGSQRDLATIVLGDLGRSDIQAYLLYRMSPESEGDYRYSLGRTYVASSTIVVPKRLWPGRPDSKGKEGTQALYGMTAWNSSHFQASNAYGLAGEAMLNFGPWSVPIAYAVFGFLLSLLARWMSSIRSNDLRTLLVPFVASLCFYLLVWDSDVTFFYIITSGLLPAFLVYVASERIVVPKPDSLTLPSPRDATRARVG